MRIGEALLSSGLITSQQLDIALKEQKKTSERLGDIVLKMGFITPEKMAPFLSDYFDLPFVDLKNLYHDIKLEAISSISEELAHRFTIIPIELENKILTIAMFDPLDLVAADTIKLKTGYKLKRVVAAEKDIREAIEYCYHRLPKTLDNIEDFIELTVNQQEEDNFEKLRVEASDPPVVQYVHSLIIQAINSGASDIHLQPKQDVAELRLRIDGILYTIDT